MSDLGNKAPARLRTFIERIERLEEERKALADDIADVYQELAGEGFDKAAAKIVLKIRRADDGLAIYSERSQIVDLYLGALGMLPKDEPRAPARAREIIEQFDAETGEISSEPTSSPAETQAADATPPASAADQFEPPAFLKKTAADYRPHCLHPEACGSSKLEHCRACAVAAGLVEAAI